MRAEALRDWQKWSMQTVWLGRMRTVQLEQVLAFLAPSSMSPD